MALNKDFFAIPYKAPIDSTKHSVHTMWKDSQLQKWHPDLAIPTQGFG